MASAPSPYFNSPFIAPRDNTGVEIIQQGLRDRYRRKMEQEAAKQKAKSAEEEMFDQIAKGAYAERDILPVDQDLLQQKSQELFKQLYGNKLKAKEQGLPYRPSGEDYAAATAFGNYAKMLEEKKKHVVKRQDDYYKDLNNPKLEASPTKEGQMWIEYNNPETSPERRKEIQQQLQGTNFWDIHQSKEAWVPKTFMEFATKAKGIADRTNQQGLVITRDTPAAMTTVKAEISDPKQLAAYMTEFELDPNDPKSVNLVEQKLLEAFPVSKTIVNASRNDDLSPTKSAAIIDKNVPIQFGITGANGKTQQTEVVASNWQHLSSTIPLVTQGSNIYDLSTGKTLEGGKQYDVKANGFGIVTVFKPGTKDGKGKDIGGEVVTAKDRENPFFKGKFKDEIIAKGQIEIPAAAPGLAPVTKDVYLKENLVRSGVVDRAAQGEKEGLVSNFDFMRKVAAEKNKEYEAGVGGKEKAPDKIYEVKGVKKTKAQWLNTINPLTNQKFTEAEFNKYFK